MQFDYLTTVEAKVYVGLAPTDSSKDIELQRAITGLSRRLDGLVGPVVRRTVTDEEIGACGLSAMELRRGPVTSFTTVTEYYLTTSTVLTQQTPGTAPIHGFRPERYEPDGTLYSGIIHRTAAGFTYEFLGDVVATYVAGRVADTASVPAEFKDACGLALKNWWRQYEQLVATVDSEFEVPQAHYPKFAVPNAVRDLLHEHVQPEVGFGG